MKLDGLIKLRAMLVQVDATGLGCSVRETLESRASGTPAGPSLDVRRTNTEALESQLALESLDALRRDGEIDAEKQFVLEAIVMPLYRPVIDVVKDYIVTDQLTTLWKELGETSRRQWITDRLLAVGRIGVPGMLYAGTGFIVGPDLVMTNRHVAAFFAQGLGTRVDFQPGQTAAIDFYHEKGETRTESLTVKKVVMIHPRWDMALLKVAGLTTNRRPLTLSTADPTSLKDRRVVVIGYPGYDPNGDQQFQRVQSRIFRDTYYIKRFQPGLFRTRDQAQSYGREVNAVTHDCSTLGGNSGSAVIDVESGHVVGLHFAGTYLVANYAVSTFDLAQDSRVVDAGVSFDGRLNPDSAYGPIWAELDSGASMTGERVDANCQTLAKGRLPMTASVSAQGATAATPQIATVTNTATVVIPLTVAVTLGAPAPGPAAAGLPAPAMALPREGTIFRAAAAEAAGRFSLESLSTDRFDWQAALSLALASKLAYAEAAAIQDTSIGKWGFQSCLPIEKDDIQCFIAAAGQVVLLSFRGTENVGNWLTDLNILSTTRSYGIVHRGFLAAFQVVEPQLRAALDGFNAVKVLLTGHSLGGALATIAAAEWQGQLPISWIYTYGQPAVGRGSFARFMTQNYGGKIFRFVNNNDIVPRVPPMYQHVGTLLHFDAEGNLESPIESLVRERLTEAVGPVAPSPAEPRMLTPSEFDRLRAQLLQQRVQARMEGLESLEAPTVEGLFPSIRDHAIDRYIAKIAAKASSLS